MKKTILAVLAVGMMIILATGAFAFNTVSAKTIFSASSDTAITQKVKLNDAIVIQKSEDKPIVQGTGELDRKTADEITGLFENEQQKPTLKLVPEIWGKATYYSDFSEITQITGEPYTIREAIVSEDISAYNPYTFSADISYLGCGEDNEFKLLVSEDEWSNDDKFIKRDVKIVRTQGSCTDTKEISKIVGFNIKKLITNYDASVDNNKDLLLTLRDYKDRSYLYVYASKVPAGISHRSAFPNWQEEYFVSADESTTFSGSASGGASGGSAAGYPRKATEESDETFSDSATAVAEVASGKSAAIRTTKITSAKLFGFIPMPWKKAVEVQVIEGNSIAEKTISEGSEETIGNYNVAVGKIVSEEEIEISVTQSEETITALEVASSTLSGNAIAEVSAGGAAAGVAKTSKAVPTSVEKIDTSKKTLELNKEKTGMLQGPVKGEANAKVKIVASMGFNAIYSERAWQQTINRLFEEYGEDKISFEFTNHPFQFQDQDYKIAQAGEVVLYMSDSETFFEFADKLLTDGRETSDEQLIKYVEEIGIDPNEFSELLNSQKLLPEVEDDLGKGKVTGTPKFIINDEFVIEGAQPYSEFKTIVEKILRE